MLVNSFKDLLPDRVTPLDNIQKALTEAAATVNIPLWTEEDLAKARLVTQVFSEEAMRAFATNFQKAIDSGAASEWEIEKAKKDLSRLAMRRVTDKNGHQRIVYVKVHEDGKEQDFNHGDKVTYEHNGKKHTGTVHSMKFNEKTDKHGTVTVKSDSGETHHKSLRAVNHAGSGSKVKGEEVKKDTKNAPKKEKGETKKEMTAEEHSEAHRKHEALAAAHKTIAKHTGDAGHEAKAKEHAELRDHHYKKLNEKLSTKKNDKPKAEAKQGGTPSKGEIKQIITERLVENGDVDEQSVEGIADEILQRDENITEAYAKVMAAAIIKDAKKATEKAGGLDKDVMKLLPKDFAANVDKKNMFVNTDGDNEKLPYVAPDVIAFNDGNGGLVYVKSPNSGSEHELTEKEVRELIKPKKGKKSQAPVGMGGSTGVDVNKKDPKTGVSVMDVYNHMNEMDDDGLDTVQELGLMVSNKLWASRSSDKQRDKIFSIIDNQLDVKELMDGVMAIGKEVKPEAKGGKKDASQKKTGGQKTTGTLPQHVHDELVEVVGTMDANSDKQKKIKKEAIAEVLDNLNSKKPDYDAAIKLLFDYEANDQGKTVKGVGKMAEFVQEYLSKKDTIKKALDVLMGI